MNEPLPDDTWFYLTVRICGIAVFIGIMGLTVWCGILP